MKTKVDRNITLVEEYVQGRKIGELAREYGISERRVAQILSDHEVTLRPRPTGEQSPLSRIHEQIGLRLHDFRFDKGFDAHKAADDLGWSMIKLRKVEKGITQLELLDLLDIAAYTETEVEDLLRGNNGS